MDSSLQIQLIYNIVEENTILFSHQLNQYSAESTELLSRWRDSRSLDFQKVHQFRLNDISNEASEILKRTRLNLYDVQKSIGLSEDHLKQVKSNMSALEEVCSESLILQQRACDYVERAEIEIKNAEYNASDAENLLSSLGIPPV